MAANLPENEARAFLLTQLKHHKWWSFMLEHLEKEIMLDDWIEKFNRLADHLDEFSFAQWGMIDCISMDSLRHAKAHELDYALSDIGTLEFHTASFADKRRVRFWVLGQVWHSIHHVGPKFDLLLDWISDFVAQPDAEKDILRRLWHNPKEQALYDSLPEEVVLFRGGMAPLMHLGFSYTLDLQVATKAAQDECGGASDPELGTPSNPLVVCRRVQKTSIVGLKEFSPYYGNGCLDVVAAPCLVGQSLGGI